MERILVKSKIKQKQNNQNLEQITKRFNFIKQEFAQEMRSYGMTNLTINKIFNGEKIINCPDCNTPNMYKVVSTHNLESYKCNKCGEISYE